MGFHQFTWFEVCFSSLTYATINRFARFADFMSFTSSPAQGAKAGKSFRIMLAERMGRVVGRDW